MNLGQLLGEQKLRILQLEDEINARWLKPAGSDVFVPAAKSVETLDIPAFLRRFKDEPAPIEPAAPMVHKVLAPSSRGGADRGVGKRVYEALADHPPGDTVGEIAAILGDLSSKEVSAWVCQLEGVLRTGQPRHYRYYRKAAA